MYTLPVDNNDNNDNIPDFTPPPPPTPRLNTYTKKHSAISYFYIEMF
jgi:hypothetical protein